MFCSINRAWVESHRPKILQGSHDQGPRCTIELLSLHTQITQARTGVSSDFPVRLHPKKEHEKKTVDDFPIWLWINTYKNTMFKWDDHP